MPVTAAATPPFVCGHFRACRKLPRRRGLTGRGRSSGARVPLLFLLFRGRCHSNDGLLAVEVKPTYQGSQMIGRVVRAHACMINVWSSFRSVKKKTTCRYGRSEGPGVVYRRTVCMHGGQTGVRAGTYSSNRHQTIKGLPASTSTTTQQTEQQQYCKAKREGYAGGLSRGAYTTGTPRASGSSIATVRTLAYRLALDSS